ncbi:hypothetical protein Runsl_0957 [Runella slithyformis DSM 19594]|uniref:Uncharacterized protein n=1 Tax=Runella slithyformis (strain ATCC 29530 / DSM 19594 / LMG 11500 / NCIMB 11436 / LSU 4) TaxID=761193 RepID=A0A7U3ZHQ1_RUNSL|nr:hypothetical protein Runsl_0957 [Runella slithyformis DSM 19594]
MPCLLRENLSLQWCVNEWYNYISNAKENSR